ncbi:urease accessory protein UreE [Yoonia sediminilitoris]|uniref:Urease accessory protein UreE n=1 Tax=Yoonia sediminilitoris TaxID=1286148 RepID=A0A2T6KPW3_9RHOB|nr:urease accessory protein UreE [Yoonia sediminilitoris]PUB18599.1 urease accessory protein [Yoonia sediminilitoris]RCW98767.1 urease accessory protein [Yoonia sediminilitoris]
MTLVANHIVHHAHSDDCVKLTYDARLLRRKRLQSEAAVSFLVDLPHTTSINAGDGFVLSDGRTIAVAAADEPLMRVTGDLVRLAWHVGNRHAPCAIEDGALVVQREKVMRAMLEQLGAQVVDFDGPFTPEGGAYGHGRTMGHDHSHSHAG